MKYFSVTDREALDAFLLLSKLEGIIPALESAHALAHVCAWRRRCTKDQIIAVCLSGRGDKDVSRRVGLAKIVICAAIRARMKFA